MAFLVSVPTCVVGTVLAVAVNFATEAGSNPLLWVAVVGLTLLAAFVPLLGRAAPEPAYRARPTRYGPPNQWSPGSGPRRPRRRIPVLVAILSVVLVVGGCTGGVVYGARYGVGWVTGNESGEDRLAHAVSATAGVLTLTVQRVEFTRHFTRIQLTATNGGQDSLSLPEFHNCQLNGAGWTLTADPQRSDWPVTVPPGGSIVGKIIFGGRPATGATTATLSFATVFGSLGGPSSISVRDIPLRPGS